MTNPTDRSELEAQTLAVLKKIEKSAHETAVAAGALVLIVLVALGVAALLYARR